MTPYSVCHDIAKKNGSPLFLVSRLLGFKKRRLFITTYAAMRIVDDLVDENFFSGDDRQRQESRESVLRQIDSWQEQALTAAQGDFVPRSDSIQPLVFIGLNETVGVSNLGPWPWIALAGAMQHDVHEREIVTWGDFLDYCEGATVAPAATFAYILACVFRDERYVLEQGMEYCRDHVREMAIFCYLIHIIRDLAKDVKKHAQLITIPRTLLEAASLQRHTLAFSLNHKESMDLLIRSLLEKAGELLSSGQEAIQKIALHSLEKIILHKLLDKYIQLFHQLNTNPTRFL
ncbi:MAG: squalene/phytoene synthase family protein [Magnetococcales bacterium]|nr:squalene/phytoene synthase family protein [Magnetococcales bacterium]MBF0438051.1 squalene/phytoene synthase family protein [Magnetococcales bacterium]